MTNKDPERHHGHHKYYIFMATIVVGAILLLLLINDNGQVSLFTGSTIGVNEDSQDFDASPDTSAVSTSASRTTASKTPGLEFKLGFDNVPAIKENTIIKSLYLTFNDLNTKIKVNNEELQLSEGLSDIVLDIENFKGAVDLNELSLSLNGEADKIIVNGVEISTKGKIKVSFSRLVYKTLQASEIKITALNFKEGSGTLVAGEKMNYGLVHETIKASNFIGDLTIGAENENILVMEGKLSGLSVKGALDLSLS